MGGNMVGVHFDSVVSTNIGAAFKKLIYCSGNGFGNDYCFHDFGVFNF